MKKTVLIVVALIVVAAGLYYYLRENKFRDFEPLIRSKLNQVVKDASDGLYSLEMDRIEVDVTRSQVTLINVHLIPDTVLYKELIQRGNAPNDLFDISLNSLLINDLKPQDFVAAKAIVLRRLYIDAPIIKVLHRTPPAEEKVQNDSAMNLYAKIKKDIRSITLDTLLINNANFIYTNKQKNKHTNLKEVNFIFTGIRIDSTAQLDRNRFLYAHDCRINLKNYVLRSSDGLYELKAGEVDIQTSLQKMEVRNISFHPTMNNRDFYRKVKTDRDIFNIEMENISFNNVQWWSLLGEESFVSETITLRDGYVRVFNDRRVQEDTRSKAGKYPHQLLMNVPFDLQIDRIEVKNVNVSYEEVNPKSDQSGKVTFQHTGGIITNVTNKRELIANKPAMKVETTSSFMGKSSLNADFRFDLASAKTGKFGVSAHMAAFPGDLLNTITVPLALVQMNNLDLKSLDVSMTGDNQKATATVKLLYDNLNITALKPTKTEKMRKRALLSFIANTFVLKKQNLEGPHVRVERVTQKRNGTRSFFNLIWKTILDGAAKTVGYKVPEN